MSVFKRAEVVAEAIGEALGRITVANGFETDIGATVYYGRTRIEDSEVPCVVVMEGNDVSEHVARQPVVQVTQRYGLVAWLPCDPEHPNRAAHAAIRDMQRAIFAADATFGRRATSVRYVGRNIGPRADGAPIVLALIEIDVMYPMTLSAP